jgi:hypothetical protein
VPGPAGRRQRPEDVQVAGQRGRPLDHHQRLRGRRPALVLLRLGPALGHPPGVGRRHPRVHPPNLADAVERLQLLRDLRRPRRLAAAGGRGRAPAHPRARPLAARRARRHGGRGDRLARRLRRHGRRVPARPLRRRPVELVRAPQPAPLLEGQ